MTAVLEAPVRRPFAPRGLGWLMWRQLRAVAWGLLALVLVAAVAAVWLHGREVDFIRSHGIAGCAMISLDPACQEPGIQQAVMDFRNSYGHLLKLAGLLLLLLPVAVGAGVGAPLLAQEWEHGTWKLVLTQSVTRRRWVLAKLAAAGLVVGSASAVLALLLRWAWQPSANDVSGISWYSWTFFGTGGPDLVATALLALAVGALAGAVLRRTLPAMAAAAVLVGLLQTGLAWLRPYLWSSQTVLVSRSELPNSIWGFAQGFVLPDGTRLPYDGCGGALDQAQCDAKYANAAEYTDLHRAADYWPLQTVETALCLGLAAALAVVTVVWVRRRLG
ncbi:ABC transporter permease subunit [Kitasatospora sp. NPDC058965]|uniref:ABC transporter permease subunit n=1 Tax=Kitasatospora sp. NPDC058965 TaxID=3346682 RepID=UPI0036745021